MGRLVPPLVCLFKKKLNLKVSAFVLDRDLGFSRRHQSDGEDEDEDDEEKVKDDKDDNEEAEEADKEEDEDNYKLSSVLPFRNHKLKPN